MTDTRLAATRAIEALIASNRGLRAQLQFQERLLNSALVRIADGDSLARTMGSVPSREERRQSEEAIREFYSRRSDVRDAVVEAALAEGLTIAEIASAFGIHHEQIVSHVSKRVARVDPRP